MKKIVEIMTDADYANDLSLLANTPAQAETQLFFLGETVFIFYFCVILIEKHFLAKR